MSRPRYLHDPPSCSIVHSHKNLLECLVKASYSALWFMVFFSVCFVSVCMREGYLSVWYWYIRSDFHSKFWQIFLAPGSDRRSAALGEDQPSEIRDRGSLGHTNLDSSVNTVLEVVCKTQIIRAPVLFLHSDEMESKFITPNTPDLPSFICVVYRFKSCT